MDGRENNLRRSSTGELLKHLSEQTTELIRKELELAKAELSQKGKVAGAGAGLLGGAAALGLLAAGALTAFIVLLLSEAMDAWLAALIVSVIYAAVAAALALAGRERVRAGMPPAPEQTVESVKEDVQWAKNRAKSVRR
jgi:hypothetical protein